MFMVLIRKNCFAGNKSNNAFFGFAHAFGTSYVFLTFSCVLKAHIV